MKRYRMSVREGFVTTEYEVEAEDKDAALAAAADAHPDASIGYPFLLDEMREVPAKRSSTSRYRLRDVDKIPDVQAGARRPGRRR